MAAGSHSDWKQELGVTDWGPPSFFTSVQELVAAGPPVPQAHSLRRAFEELKLDGILCLRGAPVVYFREVDQIKQQDISELHRRFWSQGLAPVLVLISPRDVFVYSGLTLPTAQEEVLFEDHRLVTQLNRVAQIAELRQLVLSLESGEFFRRHAHAFDPAKRVDRELLRNLKSARQEMERVSETKPAPEMLDAVLVRLIFACYLFDRKVIDQEYLSEKCGITNAAHLRDITCLPQREARVALYRLFEQLGRDFNGDLFRDNLALERQALTDSHLTILKRLLDGADVCTGQGRFWPYDFSVIPIETISAIYEHFLKAADLQAKKEAGAFYTPRFLCEVILDLALEGTRSLLDKRFLDPSCGSGIFLVGLFNRLAEEWNRENPTARYDVRASGLLAILERNLFGADLNPTACRITAFSLYLAFLDQLSPPDIRKFQSQGKFLPRLVFTGRESDVERGGKSIFNNDFFEAGDSVPANFDLVIGNPPWKSATSDDVPFVRWCKKEKLPLPDRQAAIAFAWKAPRHLVDGGKVCLVLPHGVLFNHSRVSIRFQEAWLTRHVAEVVLNLADFQRLLFEEAENPALVILYCKDAPPAEGVTIRYLTPKMDWKIAQAELLTIYPQDQKVVRSREVLADLKKNASALIWKERYWGTPRDSKLLDRLRDLPKLSEVAGHGTSRWLIGQGFQEPGPSDSPEDRKSVTLPTSNLIEARSAHFALFLLQSDCKQLESATVTLRLRSNTNTEVFLRPHVLITDGFKAAFADFDTAFRQSVRAIKGPPGDISLLIFLAAYLNSPLARYYLFHTGANIGVERAKAEAGDVLRLPFPLPGDAPAGKRAQEIVTRVVAIYDQARIRASQPLIDRLDVVRTAMVDLTELVYEYFDVDETERVLIEDTTMILMSSTRRRRASEKTATLRASTADDRTAYGNVVCNTLNDWARGGQYEVHSSIHASVDGGVAVAIFRKVRRGSGSPQVVQPADGFLPTLERLQRAFRKELGTVEVLRGVTVFDKDRLLILKPLSQRFWTRTAALNDADEIASAILSQSIRERS